MKHYDIITEKMRDRIEDILQIEEGKAKENNDKEKLKLFNQAIWDICTTTWCEDFLKKYKRKLPEDLFKNIKKIMKEELGYKW